uniref:EGF-like domain-containing protein n=1 Tax=Monopterus albus TaxID=43700 RepID=A0A3Q3KNJ1_MONAL
MVNVNRLVQAGFTVQHIAVCSRDFSETLAALNNRLTRYLCFIIVSAKELLKTCCETGEKWASVNGHCKNMEPPTKDRHSIYLMQLFIFTLSPRAAVSDSPYPKEAFSIGEERENTVEGPVEVEDMDECLIYEGKLCHHRCVNTPGSFRCECFPGYVLQEDAFTCAQDVNECLASPCSQECANIYGSYQCYCRKGYYLREDSQTCEDIDECSRGIGHLCTYRCVNVPGSYHCACPEYGYTMSPNGRSCRDIDECATGAHNCSVAETCYNIQGGYRCLSLSCPPNYRKAHCERISCPSYLECQNTPLRITYYYLSFQSNIVIPAQIFRIGPSPAFTGDNVIVSITQGNEENYFSTRKLNAYTGAVYLHRQVEGTKDFLINVEMKLWRQGRFTTFQARLYVFITASPL